MSDFGSSGEREDDPITDWLFAILRFAVTRREADRSVVLAKARNMDGLRRDADTRHFTFFSKSSAELCAAITSEGDPGRVAVLRRHFNRVENPRLRAALEAAAGLAESDTVMAASPHGARIHLWKGL